jgi:hypothetical protein
MDYYGLKDPTKLYVTKKKSIILFVFPLLEKSNHTKNDTCNEMFGSCSCPYAKPLLFVPQRENIERAKEKVMIKAKVK